MTPNPAAWIALRKAVREAHLLGAAFRVVGDTVAIDGPVTDELRAAMPVSMLREYLGADCIDGEAIAFLKKLNVTPVLVETIAGAEAAIADLDGAEILAIDIETAAPDAHPEPVRINKDGSRAVQQPPSDGAGLDPYRSSIMVLSLYSGTDIAYVLRGAALEHVINSAWLRQQHLVAHNAAFEIAFLRRHSRPPDGVKACHPVECTMQASGLMHGVWNRSLADTSQKAFGIMPPKDLQTSAWSAPLLSTGQISYAAADSVLAHDLWHELHPALKAKGRLAAYQLQRNAIPAVADMELRGLGFDRDEHARQVASWSQELAEARTAYQKLTGDPPPTTPAEIRSWLSSVAGDRLASWPKTDGGELSIKRQYLKRLILSEVDTVKPVLSLLAMQKLISTFGPKLVEFVSPTTNRIHAHYNIAGTKAGRFSASKPNLQQLPSARAPDFRKSIIAAPGHVLIGGDWSQVELRGSGHISSDPNLTAVFRDGRDLHTETASAISGVPVEDITRDQRSAAKATNFGAIYGIGPRSLAEDAFDSYGVHMTEQEARKALDRFFARYPILHRWMRQHADLCQARGYVEIGVGRVVEAPWEKDGRLTYQQCCNLPVQGAAADAMLRAIAMVFRRLRGIRGGLIATVHDELLLEVLEADAQRAKAILEETMVEAFELTFPGAPITNVVEVHIGRTWKDLK